MGCSMTRIKQYYQPSEQNEITNIKEVENSIRQPVIHAQTMEELKISMDALCDEYGLSEETIRKIIYR